MSLTKRSSLLSLTLLLAFSSATNAFDITKILGKYPDLSTFSRYITETKLADQINSRNTITVLAVDNGAISAIASKSPEAIKAIISTHIILDYFDEKKLKQAQVSGEKLTTLYQSSGLAVNQQGFLKVALVGDDKLAFGSAAGGQTDAELVKTVTTEPYNISVLQVTKPIIAPGIDSQTPGKAWAPAQSAKAPAPARSVKAGAKAPAPAKAAKSPESAEAPVASAPSPADPAEAPATSPIAADAPGPAADEEAASDVPPSGSPSTTMMGLVGAAMMAFAPLLIVW